MSQSLNEHWNRRFSSGPLNGLGWYESRPAPSLDLIERCGLSKEAVILDAGSGATTLIACLLELGYHNLYAVDISSQALEKAKGQLTGEQAGQVHWLVEDVTRPDALLNLAPVDIWHDRAMFHFLVDENDRQTYHNVLQKLVKPGGFVIMAAFAPNGAGMCSGLPVQRWSAAGLSEFLGAGFRLVESFDHIYRMPSGDLRPYVYTRFQRETGP